MSEEPRLIECPACEQNISSQAEACPNCGQPGLAERPSEGESEKDDGNRGQTRYRFPVPVGMIILGVLLVGSVGVFFYLQKRDECRRNWEVEVDRSRFLKQEDIRLQKQGCPWNWPAKSVTERLGVQMRGEWTRKFATSINAVYANSSGDAEIHLAKLGVKNRRKSDTSLRPLPGRWEEVLGKKKLDSETHYGNVLSRLTGFTATDTRTMVILKVGSGSDLWGIMGIWKRPKPADFDETFFRIANRLPAIQETDFKLSVNTFSSWERFENESLVSEVQAERKRYISALEAKTSAPAAETLGSEWNEIVDAFDETFSEEIEAIRNGKMKKRERIRHVREVTAWLFLEGADKMGTAMVLGGTSVSKTDYAKVVKVALMALKGSHRFRETVVEGTSDSDMDLRMTVEEVEEFESITTTD